MFLDFHGLLEQPFGVTPDPTYLYPTRTHREALESLSSGIKADRGFLALVAEPGMGKTTLLYQLLQELRESARTVYLFNTQCDSRELLRYVLDELGIDTQGMGLVAMHTKLNAMLFDEMLAGKRFVLVVDEAQNLSESVLETVRLLSNFETPHAKLLQIVLAGQPGLAAKLAKPELSQLRQRIAILSRLEPLTLAETECYVEHRLKVAGYWGEPLFAQEALELIARQSKGIPRNINNICYSSLSVAYARGQKTVSSEIVQEALTHLDFASDFASNLASDVASEFASNVPQSPALSEPAPAPAAVPVARSVAGPDPVAASGSVGGTHRQLAPQLTYKPLKHFNLPRWISSALALTSILLLGSFYWLPSLLRFAEPTHAAAVPTTSNDSPKSLTPFGPADASGSTLATYAADPQETDSGQVLTIAARPQQTLEEISILYLGHFDRQLYEEICALNPELKDPDHIQGGQLIRLPLRPHAMTKAIDTSEPESTAKKETPGRLFAKVVALLHGM
jgi:general secretion pathway protein A